MDSNEWRAPVIVVGDGPVVVVWRDGPVRVEGRGISVLEAHDAAQEIVRWMLARVPTFEVARDFCEMP